MNMKVWIIFSGCYHCETNDVAVVMSREPTEAEIQVIRDRARKHCASAGAGVEEHAVSDTIDASV